jgi:molecular chaperone GrpE
MSTTDSGPVPEDPRPDSDVSDNERTAMREPDDETKDQLRRALADLDNLRKRCAREVIEERAAARAETAAQWLPVVDNLERALESIDVAGRGITESIDVGGRGITESASRAADMGPVVEGVRAVRDQAVSVLESMGYRRHAEVRVPFDPYVHEAVGVTHDVDAEPGTVVQVVRPGYGEGQRQLRPAAVVVAGQRE